MARKFLTSIDLAKNELQNAVIQNLAADPSSPVVGLVYYNTVANEMRIYNGTEFEAIGLNGITASAAELNILDGATLTTTELNYVTGVTSGIQDQLNTKAPSASPTFTGTVTLDTGVDLVFEGATANAFELTLTAGDPTADRIVTLPDLTTTLVGRDTTDTLTNKTLTSPTVSGLYLSDLSIVVEGSTTDGFETTLSFVDPTADRTIYVPDANGTLARLENKLHDFALATASVDLNNQKITNLTDPTNPQDAANKRYVDAAVVGIDWKPSVRVATTAAGYLPNGFTAGTVIDGVTLALGDRILIKNQGGTESPTENGIYTVNESGAPTRATDCDTAAEITASFAVFVEEGTVNADSGWVLTNNGAITVGTSELTFTQFTGLGQIVAGAGLTKTANTLDVIGGDGITVNADSVVIDRTVVVTKYAATIGDGTNTSYTVTHNLNTRDVVVSLYDTASPYAEVMADVEHSTTNTITVLFSVAPSTNKYRVVVHG
jgi:hypothetical protein